MHGLINIGNTCFMNAALQMLFSNEDIRKIAKNNEEIAIIINAYNNASQYNPIKMKNIIACYNNIFKGLTQQDSFEFIVYFFEALIQDNKYIQTMVYQKFGTVTSISVKCKQCNYVSKHNENDLFLNLPMPMNESNDLNTIYRNYKEPELLHGNNMYKCDKCNKYVDAVKKIITSEWKNNLIIILKRFNNKMKKNNSKISIPLQWRHDYELQGGIIHMGNYNGGHYIYYGRERNAWYLANDSSISNIDDIGQFMQTTGLDSYIVIYIKKTSTL